MGEIIEISGVGRLPQWDHLKQDIAGIRSFVNLAEAFGVDTQSDPATSVVLGQMDALSGAVDLDETILMVNPHGAEDFTVFAKLQAANLLRDKTLLENEITIMGKVIRQLAIGQKQDIVRLAPGLETIYNIAKKNKTKGPRGRNRASED